MEKQRIISHSSLKEFINDGDDLDRYYLPARGLILEGKHYLLPDNPDLIQYYENLNQILREVNLPPRNAYLIPDSNYLLDLAILQNLSLLKSYLNPKIPYLIFPYAITEETMLWISELRKQGFNIEAAFPKKIYFEDLKHPSHRGGWGKWVNDPNTPTFSEQFNLPYPTSWIGQGINQIKEAYQRVVSETGRKEAFFKPIFSAGGFTLAMITSEEELMQHYEALKRQGALQFDNNEIPIEIQSFVNGITGLYSIQYTESGQLLTPNGLSKQIVNSNQWQGNIFNSEQSDDNLKKIWQNFQRGYRNYGNNFGWGGIDLAKTARGEWIILEHNGLRITGAHPAIMLAQQFMTSNQPFATLKSPGKVNCDLITMWNILGQNKLAFDPTTKQGVFPIVWFPGSGMLWATGENPLKILNDSYNILQKEGYIL